MDLLLLILHGMINPAVVTRLCRAPSPTNTVCLSPIPDFRHIAPVNAVRHPSATAIPQIASFTSRASYPGERTVRPVKSIATERARCGA